MNAASTLAFPGSRTLAGWWRQLSACSPQALWVGHLLLHQVEALCGLVHPCLIDPFTRHLLGALTLEESRAAAGACDALRRLDEHLHLGAGLLGQALRALAREGLADSNGSGGWRLTPAGHQARDAGEYPRAARERRVFHFVEPQGRGRPPHFLPLRPQVATPVPPPDGWGFDPDVLRDCVARPAEWKRRYGFPEEVRAILGPGDAAPPWEQVMLDRPERLLAVLARAGDAGAPRLLGFAARQDGWALQSGEPAFAILGDWSELFPGLSGPTAREVLVGAWRGWAASRGLPDDEAAACAVEAEGERLRVLAPASLVGRLRASRSDALRGEAWVLTGEGDVRQALLLEVVESPS